MKNLFKATILLTCFSLSLALIQLSCSKSDAQPGTQNNIQTNQNSVDSVSQLNKIIYAKYVSGGELNIWVANYDGSGASQIPIALGSTRHISNDLTTFSIRLSPYGQKIFFVGYDTSTSPYYSSIYSCNTDGSNVQIVVSSTKEIIKFGGADNVITISRNRRSKSS